MPQIGSRTNGKLAGTDNIVIAKARDPSRPKVKLGSMEEARKRIQNVRYLLKEWIPFGMLTLIIAEPGMGKSAFTLYGIAKPVSTGGDWFNGMRGPSKPGLVLWCDTESRMAQTLTRMAKWGIPDNMIRTPREDVLDPIDVMCEDDLEQIEYAICDHQIKLVVIDPLRGSHQCDENDSRVVSVLQNLARIAERTNAAIVVVHHTHKLYNKELTANSCRGSNALIATASSMFGVEHPDGNPKGWGVVKMLKENLGIEPKPIGFLIGDTGIEFGTAPERPRHQTHRNQTERDRAEVWIKSKMQPGTWYSAGLLEREAFQEGLSHNALQRAREVLGIMRPNFVRKEADGWKWILPQ